MSTTWSLTKKEMIDFLQAIKELLNKTFGFKEIFLYGSYAKDSFHTNSDIDLLIFADKTKKTYANLLQAEKFLRDNLHSKIDLVFSESLNPIIATAIQQELIKIE